MFDVVSDLSSTERIAVLEAARDCTTQEELGMYIYGIVLAMLEKRLQGGYIAKLVICHLS